MWVVCGEGIVSAQRARTWRPGMKLSLKHKRMEDGEDGGGGVSLGSLCFPIVPEVNSEKSPIGFSG